MGGNKTGETEWEALSVAIFTIHWIFFISSFSTVTSATLLHHLFWNG
jgi:hypothetical protein